MLRNLLLVGAGGAIGSILRYLVALAVAAKTFPYATLIVNIAGCFIIGIVLAYSMKNEYFLANWRLFLATGICGGFTTFSAFSMENLQLLQNGKWMLALLYIVLSIVLGIAAALGGYQLMK